MNKGKSLCKKAVLPAVVNFNPLKNVKKPKPATTPIDKRIFQGTLLKFLKLNLFLKNEIIKNPKPTKKVLNEVKRVGSNDTRKNLFTIMAKPLTTAVITANKIPMFSLFIYNIFTNFLFILISIFKIIT